MTKEEFKKVLWETVNELSENENRELIKQIAAGTDTYNSYIKNDTAQNSFVKLANALECKLINWR